MKKVLVRALVISSAALLAVMVADAETIHVRLAYNFNGMVHVGEAGRPDDPDGFRSISDRALDLQNGVPSNPVLDNYVVVDQPGVLDIVHLGDRNTVDGGNWAFGTANGPNIGTQPNWLPNSDQTGPQTTTLDPHILMDVNSTAGVIFQISNGGGVMDVRCRFNTGSDIVATVFAPDWFGPFNGQPNIGQFPGTQDVDMANPGDNLLLTQAIVQLGAAAGRELVSISFENRSNARAGYAVIAVNVEGTLVGCDPCDANCDGAVNAFDIEPFIDVVFNGAQPCSSCAGDANGDGELNAFDIEPFIECLFGP